nr:piggyBac transposable element-derived protein 4-like isoform X1 [Procambarus clarkii]
MFIKEKEEDTKDPLHFTSDPTEWPCKTSNSSQIADTYIDSDSYLDSVIEVKDEPINDCMEEIDENYYATCAKKETAAKHQVHINDASSYLACNPSINTQDTLMATSTSGSRPCSGTCPTQSLSDDESHNTLFAEEEESDIDDSDFDNYTQGTDRSDSDSDNDAHVASGYGVCGVTRHSFAASDCPGNHHCVISHGENEGQKPSSSTCLPSSSSGHAHSVCCRRASSPSEQNFVGARIHGRGVRVVSARTPDVIMWSDGADFVPQIPTYDNTGVGVTDLFPYTGEEVSEMEYFMAYFDEPLMKYIVQETNKYVVELIESVEILQFSRLQRWKDTTVGEMYVFLALCMMMKHCVKNVITDYWSKDSCVPTPIFGKYMSRDRFVLLLRCLNFANNEDQTKDDRLWKVRHILNELIGKFRDFYKPAQKLVIIESLALFKGRVAFKKCIPSKRHRFKFFVLCDCETGMVLYMILYSDSNVDIPGNDQHGFSGSVVKTIMAPWLNKGHILYTDNYYTSPLLTRFLLENRTGVCGTVKTRRREMPVFDNKIAVGECQLRKTDQILSVRWKYREEVNILTTIHTGTMVHSGKVNKVTKEQIYEPDCVMDYNINTRLVDKCDMMMSTVECIHKTVKWPKKMFFHLVDITMLNSYNMYLVKTGHKPTFRVFSFSVVTQLLKKFGKDVPGIQRPIQNPVLHHAPTPRLTYTEAFQVHRIKHLPPTGKRAIGQRVCIVCKTTQTRPQKRKLVQTWCEACAIPLCAVNCFNDYHSLQHF